VLVKQGIEQQALWKQLHVRTQVIQQRALGSCTAAQVPMPFKQQHAEEPCSENMLRSRAACCV